MADKARPCPCTDPNLPEFEWVSTVDPIAGRVLIALHTDKGILTGEECSECGSKKWDWNELAAIVIATKTTDDVQRALDVVRQQFPTGRYNVKEFARLLRVLSTLYQEKMLTEQEVEELKPKPLWNRWNRLVVIQCTKPPDVVKRTTELLAEVGCDEQGKRLKVLAALYQKNVIAEQDLQKLKGSSRNMLLGIIFDLCTRPSEDVATTADVLDMVGWKNEAEMLKVLSVLYQKKVLDHHEVVEMHQETRLWRMVEPREVDLRVKEVLWQGLVNVQCRKPPKVVTTTAEVLDELGLKEEATQLRVMSELYRKRLISEHDLSDLSFRYMRGSSSRHWLDSLVDIQSSKSADVHARTFDTLRRYSLTEVVQERQTKHTDVTTKSKPLHSPSWETSEMLPSSFTSRTLEKLGSLPKHLLSKDVTTKYSSLKTVHSSSLETSEMLSSSDTKRILEKWGRLSEHLLSKESQLVPSLEELSVSPSKTKVSSLQAGGGSDPPVREDASNLLTDEAALKRLCWIPFGIKTVSIEAEGGMLCLEPTGDDIQVAKEDTIFVEVPPDAVSTSADVKMRYAIIPSGAFTLPEGYQFGSSVVYIYYDGRRVTKPLALHLPHWYGGEDHARDGLSFAVAPHSLKERSVYHFQLLAGGKFPGCSRYGVVEIHGHCSLFAEVFKLGARVDYHAFCLNKEEEEETEYKRECNIAVMYASFCWRTILQENRPGWEVSKPAPFQFKSDKITATLEKHHHHENDDRRANFCGAPELLPRDVQYSSCGIYSDEQLEMAVKNSSYPPTIECLVRYRKELKRTGRRTEVKLLIDGMDRKMEFSCPAYELKQVLSLPPVSPASSTHTGAAHTPSVCSSLSKATSFAPPPHTPGPAQTEATSQPQPSVSLWEAAPEFLDHCRKQFIAEVDASVIVLELEHRGIISDGNQKTIRQEANATLQAQLLHACLKKTCNAKALTDVCDIIATVKGNPRMKSFGEHMKTEWEKVSQKPSRQDPPTGPQSGDSLWMDTVD